MDRLAGSCRFRRTPGRRRRENTEAAKTTAEVEADERDLQIAAVLERGGRRQDLDNGFIADDVPEQHGRDTVWRQPGGEEQSDNGG